MLRSLISAPAAYAVAAGWLLLGAPRAPAQDEQENTPPKKIQPAEAKFTTTAMQKSRRLTALNTLASSHAEHREVTLFATKLVRQQTKLQQELKRLAEDHHFELQDGLEPEDQKQVDAFAELSGREFDLALMQQDVKGLLEMVSDFDKASRQMEDPVFKKFAARQLPNLKTTLKQAQTLAASVINRRR